MGWRSILKGIHHEAELHSRDLRREANGFQYLFLKIRIVNAEAAAADLYTVQHHVVGVGLDPSRISGEIRHIFVAWRGKGMVHGFPTLFLVAVFKHRKIHHP